MDWARRIELFTVVVAAVVAVVGLWYSDVQTRQANAQAWDDRALAKEGQITDRYTAAVGNLGEDKVDVRLGGIYALQRIMQDSRRDQPTIAHVLAAYIRTHAAKAPAKGQDVPADVHAALTVLATRNATRDDDYFLLDLHAAKLPRINSTGAAFEAANLSQAELNGAKLSDADLNGAKLSHADLKDSDLGYADLNGAHLFGANLNGAHLFGADLEGTNLSGVDLNGADLGQTNWKGANLKGANLSNMDLSNTDLEGANLKGANLNGARLGFTVHAGTWVKGPDLSGARLSGANLNGVNLTFAQNLTREQVDSAVTDSDTRLPASLR